MENYRDVRNSDEQAFLTCSGDATWTGTTPLCRGNHYLIFMTQKKHLLDKLLRFASHVEKKLKKWFDYLIAKSCIIRQITFLTYYIHYCKSWFWKPVWRILSNIRIALYIHIYIKKGLFLGLFLASDDINGIIFLFKDFLLYCFLLLRCKVGLLPLIVVNRFHNFSIMWLQFFFYLVSLLHS